ncbi:MAG: DNA mismatch repair endonuclease MutL [Candidatus Velthaea sp.]
MIRLLDPQTVGQIAAGEVIERPLSVVKELVENALDADARRIAVRVRGGGISDIEVADDGSGIDAGDVPRALLRHATSKLRDARALTQIDTLGFRGEGLASIAAISRVTIVSRTAEAQIATAVDAFGESIGEPRPLAGPLGTRVVVRDLFSNVPVRREYLRSPGAEFARISQWLATLALAYPHVGFTLEHDGRQIFAFAPDDDLSLRLAHVFGRSAQSMVAVTNVRDGEPVRVSGWVSSPGDDRADRRAQVLFVNGRLLRSTLVSGAWTAAYRTFAMVGRYPYGVLYVAVPPDEVDPNVHPTKSDVRLRHGERVVSVVKEAMSTALRRGAVERLERSISFAPPVRSAGSAPVVVEWSDSFLTAVPETAEVPALRVLAQVDRTFILATDGRAVVLIDQHAAHERVVFEQLAMNARKGGPSEPLLVPLTFEVRPEEAERLDASLEALTASGLAIETFGERAYRITATPARIVHAGKTRIFDVADFIDGLSDELRGLESSQRVWASLACHSVVRAGDRLEFAEMTTLVERLQQCENPMHCPHGRPTIVRLEPDQIARLFKRL